MKYDNFFTDSGDKNYCVTLYFYRVEFQQRGAPHVHSLLWLKDKDGKDAPTFWTEETELQVMKLREKKTWKKERRI